MTTPKRSIDVGDFVVTPLGRRAKVVGEFGGRLGLRYTDPDAVMLHPNLLRLCAGPQQSHTTGKEEV